MAADRNTLDDDLDQLEAELSAVMRWRGLSPDLRDKLFARLRELKAQAPALKEKRRA